MRKKRLPEVMAVVWDWRCYTRMVHTPSSRKAIAGASRLMSRIMLRMTSLMVARLLSVEMGKHIFSVINLGVRISTDETKALVYCYDTKKTTGR